VAVYSVLYHVTGAGADILTAQWIFVCLYLLTTLVVFMIYRETRAVPPYVLVLLCLSKRVHSIFALRLFNDGVAMFLLYLAILLFIRNRWSLGCLVYSAALSVKMNILLFFPALGILLVKRFGLLRTIPHLLLIAALQLVVAAPFLSFDAHAYVKGAFDFGRQFFYKWTVNWKMLPEDLFLDGTFALCLLAAHGLFLLAFIFFRWTRREGGPFRVLFSTPGQEIEARGLGARHITLMMFSANFVGMAFSRSLHYQFYSWYFHTLPFLLWHSAVPLPLRFFVLMMVEYAWNVFPATPLSSSVLAVAHGILLAGVWAFNRDGAMTSEVKPASDSGKVGSSRAVEKKTE